MSRECVLLLHGLGESELRMLPLELHLRQKGYRTVSRTYPSTLYPAERLAADHITPLLNELAREDVLHVVTHSLGRILLHTCLQALKQPNLGRVVMLTPAHHGSSIMELYRHHPLFNLFCGPVTQQTGLGEHCFPCGLEDAVDYELGIIAGCLPLDPLSWLAMPWPHDGRASVKSTKLRGMKDHIVIPASHEFITFHPLAALQTHYFLKHGQFFTLEKIMKIKKDENSKNPAFQVPMDLPHAKPEDYDTSIDSGRGSANNQKGVAVTPDEPKNPAKEKQKEGGQLPLHDEPIGGA